MLENESRFLSIHDETVEALEDAVKLIKRGIFPGLGKLRDSKVKEFEELLDLLHALQ